MAIVSRLAGGTALLASPVWLMQSLRWTGPGGEIEVLTTQPSSCMSITPRDRAAVQAGMALFNTPTLLGGQAAKAGLSCSSCHPNGRDNRHFLLPGVSGKAGTADVTSSFFSSARGNGVDDPVQIPDLALPGKVSRAAGEPALEHFIRNLIVEEFAGSEPSPTALLAIAAYVRAIRKCGDSDKMAQNRQLSDQLGLINAAIDGASAMQRQGDTPTARLLIGGARHQLGLIAERFGAKRFTAERRMLLNASEALRKIAENNDNVSVPVSIAAWRRQFDRKLVPRLMVGEPRSLYSKKQIAKAMTLSH